MNQETALLLGEDERAKRAALRRTKAIATAALVACVGVFLLARGFRESYPALAYVAAFAEAAAIGGIADWYAVVALFRRPLGLPIPHTAIIPRNQVRIADNLGRFVETNFLAPAAVHKKLGEVDFAAMMADWLQERRRAEALSGFVMRLMPQTLAALEGSGLRDFIGRRLEEQLERVEVAPVAASALDAFTADRRHQQIFDEMLKVFARFLSDEAALAQIRGRIRDELPTLARLFRADAYLLKKLVASAAGAIEEVKDDPDHPLRAEFDSFIARFIDRLRTSPDYAARAERIKRELLARPELRQIGENMWAGLRAFIEKDAAAPRSALKGHLTGMFMEAGRQLSEGEAIRKEMNRGFVVALSSFLSAQRSGVAEFIAGQVRQWDLGRLTDLVEINIGRDLQYIRFNGMIIGGIAGLLLHVTERAIFAN